jgi:hypothetical protein
MQVTEVSKPSKRLGLRKNELPISYPQARLLMERGEFPRARDVCGSPVWLVSEVEAWLAARPVRPMRGDPGAEGLYAQQQKAAAVSAESRRRSKAKARRDNVRVRAKRAAPPRKAEKRS